MAEGQRHQKTNTMNELFSVVVPTFNRQASIVATLQSIFDQSYRPIEIVIVDDGSSDETVSVCHNWWNQAKSTELLTFKLLEQKNAGAAAARNCGFKEVSGTYLQYLDSDDLITPDRFSKIVEAMQQHDADFVQTTIESFDPKTNQTIGKLVARPWANQVELVLNGDFWANTLRAAITVELANKIGPFIEDMTCFEDRDYFERAVLMAQNPIAIEGTMGRLARGEGEHVSSRHTTFEGRKWRIFCETRLVDLVNARSDIPGEWKSALASRIYRLGCRSCESGWYDYGKQCAQLGDLLNAKLTTFAIVKRRLAYSGRIGGMCYKLIDGTKKRIFKRSKA